LTPVSIEATDSPAPHFVVDGRPFCFAGANNYYLGYQPREAVLDVLTAAADMELGVVRIWGFLDRGSLDGRVRSVREPGHKSGVFFQSWDAQRRRPAYNDGPDGLERLDFVLHHARRLGLRLVIVFTNNWRDFGGMDQYLVWYGLDRHHLFFTDARVKRAYKDWIHHLVTRRNSIDGVLYAEDPAVFAWELANEPRTTNGEEFDRRDGWSTATITRWADEMSAYVKSLDANHMVAVGDEGFLRDGREHWAYQAPHGVDHEALSALPHVDFGTFHLYPDHWNTDRRWGVRWIEDHVAVARRIDKPTVLEEYGLRVERAGDTEGPVVRGGAARAAAYRDWNRAILWRGGAGALFWMLSGQESSLRLYPDYDHFAVYRGEESFSLLAEYARRAKTEARSCALAQAADLGASSQYVRAQGVTARGVTAQGVTAQGVTAQGVRGPRGAAPPARPTGLPGKTR
jgi:mannan endo-1,4-beta-mannosidase